MLKLTYSAFLILFLLSCDMVVYSPNEVRPAFRDLNRRAIEKIEAAPVKTNYNFILTGDTQRFYDDMEDFVKHVNQLTDISFVLVAGDLTDFGQNREYKWVGERLGKLNIPYVGVLGNHDMLANGRQLFHEMYGPENFSFFFGGHKFISINTNSREVRFNGSVPDINFLKTQLADNRAEKIFVVSHVPPFSGDFDPELENDYANALAAEPRVAYSLHGHEHHFYHSEPYNDGVPYVVSAATNKRSYVLVTVNNNNVSISEKTF